MAEQHSPSSSHNTLIGHGQDPQLMALVDGLVHDRLMAIEQSYRHEIALREQALQAQQQEGQILQGRLDALQSQLMALQVHSGYVFHLYNRVSVF